MIFSRLVRSSKYLVSRLVVHHRTIIITYLLHYAEEKLYCFSKLFICYCKSLSLLLVLTCWYVFFWIPLCFCGTTFLLPTNTVDFDLFYQVIIKTSNKIGKSSVNYCLKCYWGWFRATGNYQYCDFVKYQHVNHLRDCIQLHVIKLSLIEWVYFSHLKISLGRE